MAIIYKDIDLLTQKSSIAGTEKIPVSDTQYVSISQLLALAGGVTITSPSPADGTLVFTLPNGDTVTVDLNHDHPQYATITYVDTTVGNIETLLAAI